jgi:hypothetical protein
MERSIVDEPLLYTEYSFTLPQGYVDSAGTLHRHGTMRLATAADEVEPLSDERVRANHAYIAVLLLSRVVVSLGDLESVSPEVIECLFSADFVYLQDLYVQINDIHSPATETQCPQCGSRFALALAGD